MSNRAALHELLDVSRQRRTRQPVVLLASDDWGQSAVPDRFSYDRTVHALGIGGHPFDAQGLETSQDVDDLCELLSRHRDSRCRPPVLSAFFILANIDPLASMEARTPVVLPIDKGWPGSDTDVARWSSYRAAIANGLMEPGLHGITHCSVRHLDRAVREGGQRGAIVEALWGCGIPYLPSLTPWAAFAYEDAWDPSAPGPESHDVQKALVDEGASAFRHLFGGGGATCAPGYRQYPSTLELLRARGFDRVQTGVQPGGWGPVALATGTWSVPRNVSFEVSIRPADTVQAALRKIERLVEQGFPAVLSIHSINFQSAIRDHKSTMLYALEELLTALERRYAALIYASSGDLQQHLRPTPRPGREVPWHALTSRAAALLGKAPHEDEPWA